MAKEIPVFNDFIQETCCNCSIRFAMTQRLYNMCKSTGKSFYCPVGHSQHYTDTEITQLRKEVEERTAQRDNYSQRYEEEKQCCVRIERSAIALRGHITRLKRA